MRKLFVGLFAIALVATVLFAYMFYLNQRTSPTSVKSGSVQIQSGDSSYPAYVAAPETDHRLPGVVLIHSFNGLEPGYKTMIDKLASDGFVVIAPEWQNFTRTPRDEVVAELVSDAVAYLQTRSDVDMGSLGLTGFCAGGRFTMLFLPQMSAFKSGIAWYGFPYSGGSNNQSKPAEFVQQLSVPMLIIHGTQDQASNITGIYNYANSLDQADKYFEMKIYQGQPHGFMIQNGQLSQSFPAQDAYWQMVTFFERTLK